MERARERRTRKAAAGNLIPLFARSLSYVAGALAIAATFGATLRAGAAPGHTKEIDRLLAFEQQIRARTDFASLPPWRELSGADPYALRRLPDSPLLVAILRGADAVVVLDRRGRELDRHPAPRSPTGLAVTDEGEVIVVGESSPLIARFQLAGDKLKPKGSIEVRSVLGLRDVAPGPDLLHATDPIGGRVLAVEPVAGEQTPRVLATCHEPIQVLRAGARLVVNCFLDHALVVLDGGGSEIARIVHDGPFWSSSATTLPDGSLLVAAGGIEDRPLDRSDGSFAYIDSFVYLYRVLDRAERLAKINVSELGVVTPKWLGFERDADEALRLHVAGYGSDRLISFVVPADHAKSPSLVASRTIPPGTTGIACGVAANPLLDAWIVLDERGAGDSGCSPAHEGSSSGQSVAQAVPVPSAARRSADSRLGEALFFTTLMAPFGSSEGRRSRFTCETCHHEGYVDGRTHYTGRDDVHATTKPLRGLHGNRPYFSRALDPTMARMVQNEFRVANRGSGKDSWFSLRRSDFPWLEDLGVASEELSAEQLRRALMAFLVDFSHDENPAVLGRNRWTPVERRGAEIFHRECETCHAARLVTDQASSRISFQRWETFLFAGEPIVWGREGYEKAGVLPYVHPDGTRVPSLRRLGKKYPYFTNGSAKSLSDVLARATLRDGESGFSHDHGPTSGRKLLADERTALLAFLNLL